VLVAGTGEATPEVADTAEQVGRALAERGAIVVCGGLGGVMEAACRGARQAGGITVGILPGTERAAANPHLTIALPTGFGELRNGLLVRAADAVIAVGRGYGTLSEIALAPKAGRPPIGLGSWEIDGVEPAPGPAEAVGRALTLAGCPPSSPPT